MAIMKRRKPRGILKKTKEALWPTMGWRRTFHYYSHRMFRTGDSDYEITGGLAMGAAISFTPFLGTHILQAMFLSWLVRASIIAGAVGTFIGNPWTYPVMFVMAYKLGIRLCTFLGIHSFDKPPQGVVIANADHEPWEFFMHMLAHPVEVLLPLTLGGYLCTLLFWPFFYVLLYYPVRTMRHRYLHRRTSRGRRGSA